MSDMTIPNEMLWKANFDVNWRKKEIVKAKIRADFTGLEGDQRELDRHFRELAIEENYLKVLEEKFSEEVSEPAPEPSIVRWALTR